MYSTVRYAATTVYGWPGTSVPHQPRIGTYVPLGLSALGVKDPSAPTAVCRLAWYLSVEGLGFR